MTPACPLPQEQIRRRQGTPGQTRLLLKRPGARHTPANDVLTPGCHPGMYGPDKDGVDWAFGSFNEAAVNDFQEKNRDQ